MKKLFKGWLISTLAFPLILLFIILTMLGNSNLNTENINIPKSISAEVLQWQPLVEKYATQFGIADYVPLILAIIQQESGGNTSLDVMQSSEGAYNTRFAHTPNAIIDPEYSIWCGVQEIKDALTKAGVTSPTDILNISLALQTYNFGTEFLNFAKFRGGYTEIIAIEFSNIMAKKMGWTSYGDPQYVQHVLRYYSISNAPSGNSELLNKVVQIAMAQQGKAYVWGASGPDTFDCSGLVYYAYSQAGFKIDRATAQDYYNMCEKITTPEVGDLIFFKYSNSSECHHIGIYIGNNQMINAPSTGDVVKVQEYANRSDFIGYGRLKQ